jgi:hypothetical protein
VVELREQLGGVQVVQGLAAFGDHREEYIRGGRGVGARQWGPTATRRGA